jgi:Tat protein translocase TatC
MSPITHIFGDQPLVLLNPFETFTLRFKVALYATLVVGSPIIIWQVMAFFLPALKPKERKWIVPTFAAMVILFAAGVTFAHQIILGTAFEWIVGQAWEGVTQMPEASTYFQGSDMLLLGFGLAFQLPVVVFYLMIFNIVPYDKLRANWRIVYTAHVLVSPVRRPTGRRSRCLRLFAALISTRRAWRSPGWCWPSASPRRSKATNGGPCMHEMGIVAASSRRPRTRRSARTRPHQQDPNIKVGELTEIVDDALQFAFEALSPGTLAEGAELVVETWARRRSVTSATRVRPRPLRCRLPGVRQPLCEIVSGPGAAYRVSSI